MSDFKQIISEDKPTLVDFFATWCGPCRVQGPILEEVKKRVGDEANIIKIDIDRNQELSAVHNVRSVPTLMIFQKGELKWRQSGVQSCQALEEELSKYY